MESDVSKPEFYYPYLLLFILLFTIIQLTIYLFKKNQTEELNQIEDSVLIKNGNNLKIKYIEAFLTSKGAMWAKAPYTFMLFSTFHQFTISQIGVLYLIDAVFSLLTGPFLGFLADTFGRKKISFFYPFNTIIILIFRMTGNIPLAYLAQVISGCSSSILATSFESWLNFEITKLYGNNTHYIKEYKKSIFLDVILYDCILSIIITILGAVLYTFFGIFSSLSLAVFISLVSALIIIFRWNENKPNECSRINPLASIWEGIKLIKKPEIVAVGILDSMHMSGINVFNFIWTPILQITANSKDIHPGMIFIMMLISFLIHNKILEVVNKIFSVNYYVLCTIFNLIFITSFMGIYFFESWNVRMLCLMIISGSGGLFHPIISYIKSNLLIEQYRTLLMNLFRIPLNITLITMLLLTNYFNPFTICLIVGIINISGLIASLYLIYYNYYIKKHYLDPKIPQ